VLFHIRSVIQRKRSLLRPLMILALSIAVGMALIGVTVKTVAAKAHLHTSASPSTTNLTAVSMIPSNTTDASSTEGWMVGANQVNGAYTPLYLHYQDQHWSNVTTNVPTCSCLLSAISMVDHDHGWIFGTLNYSSAPTPVFMKYDRGKWSTVSPPSSYQGIATNLSVVSQDEFWAMAIDPNSGALEIIHYHGGNWTMFSIFSYYAPTCLGTTDHGDAWVGTDELALDFSTKSIIALSANIVHTVGNDISKQPWSEIPGTTCNALQMQSATDGWGAGASSFVLAYNPSSFLYHFDGTHWTPIPGATRSASIFQLLSIAGADDVWVEGTHTADASTTTNFFAHYLKGTTTFIDIPGSAQDQINSLSMANANEGWAVGQNTEGMGVLYHYSNGAWATSTYNS
jgi:hypothetical protein